MHVDRRTDSTALVGRRVQHGHMVGRFTDLRHLTIHEGTGLSWTGLGPGLVGWFSEEPTAVCRGGNTATYVPYGDLIDILDS